MKENELRGILKRPQPDSSMDRRIAENILKYNVNHANNRQRAAVIYNKFIKNSFVGLTCAISAAAIILVLAGGIISRFSQVRQDDRENIQKNVQTSPANGTKAGDEISATDEQVASDKSIHLLDFGMTEKKAVRLGNSHGNKANMGLICEYDGWIYYSDYNNDGYLAKMRPDGSDKQILLKEKCGYINLMNDYLYFKGEDGRIKRCRPDGSDLVSLTDKYVGEILVTSERIYFTSDCIEGIDLNGGNHERLTNEGKYYSLDIFGDYIFYTEYTDTFKIHAVKTDGSQQYLVRENARDGVILGNYLYYVDLETNRYCRFNLTTGKTESGSYGLFPHQVNDILYTNGKAGIYIYDNIYEESGMRLKKEYYFNVDIVLNFYLAGERIYVIIEDWHEREKVKDVYLAEINPDTGELIRIE